MRRKDIESALSRNPQEVFLVRIKSGHEVATISATGRRSAFLSSGLRVTLQAVVGPVGGCWPDDYIDTGLPVAHTPRPDVDAILAQLDNLTKEDV